MFARRFQSVIVLLSIIVLLLLSPLVPAAENEVVELDKVTVVGERNVSDRDWATREDQFYRSYSRETIGSEIIVEEGAADIAEAISDISGVSINAQGAFSKSITIRGLDGPRVGTSVDGVRIANQGMNHTGAGEINMTDLNSVLSIDVIKGSPSVTFDPGASGGVVQVQTLSAPSKRGVSVRQRASYNEGYGKTQLATTVAAGNGRIGGLIMYSQDDASDYKIAGQAEDTELLINRYRLDQEMSTGSKTLKDLGYDANSLTARGRVDFGSKTRLDLGLDRWQAKDIVFIHGNTTDRSASIFQYDKMKRNRHTISLHRTELANLENIEIKLANQQLYQLGSSETILDSNTVSAGFDLAVGDARLLLGGELILDEAETLVYSEQDYFAGYLQLEYEISNWIFSGGVRANYWATRQRLPAGTNEVVASQLLGISGITPEKTTAEPTWALGLVYKLTYNQHIGFNLSSTYRIPDLYERYAFGTGFVGGGLQLQAESGKHAELTWKYLSHNLAVSASVFYSNFDHFINTKAIRTITDYTGLQDCILIGKCDPANGDYNDQESQFFSQYVKYYNAEDVRNSGSEISVRWEDGSTTLKVGASYSDFDSDDLYVLALAHPLRLDASYKYRFSGQWKPWLKLKGEYVTDYPEVRQKRGFDPYLKVDCYAGLKLGDLTLNAGVNNFFNKVYRPPYNGINGLERSYFVNIDYQWSR
ncbi:MAG: TonB-dependent receptor [Gammaproteobacteria bacterium]|nr:MAG: TonB-dependent receptor [Pseudomonadota bacterium]PIE38988.1 MAG: TonB-dependent receptor [Gammaproteobacteria bacterium]